MEGRIGHGRPRRDGSPAQPRWTRQQAMAAARLRLLALHRAKAAAILATPMTLAKTLGFQPDPWQTQVLTSTSNRLLLNCCRQSGKTTTTALVALYEALAYERALVLIISPGERQSGELFLKVKQAYRDAGRPVLPVKENELSLWLENGSRIIALPGSADTIRGFSGPRLIVLDESAWVPDALYFALRPMLAVSHGRLIALSTPFGKRGWWSDAWHDQKQAWERFLIPADQCPRITPEFLAEERLSMEEWRYKQEYWCSFEAAAGAVFSEADIEAAQAMPVALWDWLLAAPDELEPPITPPSAAQADPWAWIETTAPVFDHEAGVIRPMPR